ncbi:phage portal protein [Niveispirillum sp.]|uniref:phage portal protein n=1 Tax=Niveispirillum sp. TaxID=1917217 RepID=UPI001B68336E|nr:phage portal protein [Niveispirillum sp.]MBP7339102.1 phage portal protein [Niveispirillum sp.]
MLNRIKALFGGGEAKDVSFAQSWMDAFFGGGETLSGEIVSTHSAVQVTAFYRGMMVIADGLAQLPLELYRKTGNGVEAAEDEDLYDLLSCKPNGSMNGAEWVHTTVMHAVATGNAVSWRNVVNGELRELIPVKPECTQIETRSDLDMRYTLTLENGRQIVCGRDEVFHLRGPSWNAVQGLDPVLLGREALGLAQVIARAQAASHKNGVKGSALFTLEGNHKPDDPSVKAIRELIQQIYSGADNKGKAILASAGLKFQQLAMNSKDSETLDTRKFQIEEIARLLGVFAIMLGHAGDQSPTFASADAFFEAHVRYTLQPWIGRLLAACNEQFLTREQRRAGMKFRMDTSELIRGSLSDRTEYYKAALGNGSQPGWLSPEEVRVDDGWNPVGDPRMSRPWHPQTSFMDGARP